MRCIVPCTIAIRLTDAVLNRVVGDAAPRIAVVVVIAIRMAGIRGIGFVAAVVAAIIPVVMPFASILGRNNAEGSRLGPPLTIGGYNSPLPMAAP